MKRDHETTKIKLRKIIKLTIITMKELSNCTKYYVSMILRMRVNLLSQWLGGGERRLGDEVVEAGAIRKVKRRVREVSREIKREAALELTSRQTASATRIERSLRI